MILVFHCHSRHNLLIICLDVCLFCLFHLLVVQSIRGRAILALQHWNNFPSLQYTRFSWTITASFSFNFLCCFSSMIKWIFFAIVFHFNFNIVYRVKPWLPDYNCCLCKSAALSTLYRVNNYTIATLFLSSNIKNHFVFSYYAKHLLTSSWVLSTKKYHTSSLRGS